MSGGTTLLEQAAAEAEAVATVLDSAQMVISRVRLPISGAASDLGDPAFRQECFAVFDRMFGPDGNVWADVDAVMQTVARRCEKSQVAVDWCDSLFGECERLDALYPQVMGHIAAVSELIEASPVNEATRTWTREVFGALPSAHERPHRGFPPWTDLSTLTDDFADRKRTLEKSRAELISVQTDLTKVMESSRLVRHVVTRVEGLIADRHVSETSWRAVRPHLDRVIAYVIDGTRSDFWTDVHRLIDVLQAEALS